MTFSAQLKIGYKSYPKALNFIFKNRLSAYFLIPIALNILLIVGGESIITSYTDDLKEIINQWLSIEDADFFLSEYLEGFLSVLVSIFVQFFFFLFLAFLGGHIIIIFLSPVFSILSEKTEYKLNGKEYHANFKQTILDIVRGIGISLRNMLIEIFLGIIAFFLGFIPVVGLFAAIALFLMASYFFGFSYIDLMHERRRFTIKQSIKRMRKLKGVAIANGSVFALALMIPFCGASIAVFVAIVSVVAATIAIHEIEQGL